MLKVIERKSKMEGTAVQLEDGRFGVTLNVDGAEQKTYSASTFKRNYKVVEEIQVTTSEEENKVEDIKIVVGEQELAPMEVPTEIKAGDYVQLTEEDADFKVENLVGIVVDRVNDLATIAIVEEKTVTEICAKVDKLVNVERVVAEKTFAKIEKYLEKTGEETPEKPAKPAKAEKPAKVEKPHWTPETGFVAPQPQTEEEAEDGIGWCESGVIDTFHGNINGDELVMIDREVGEFHSKGEVFPKYFDTFNINGFILKVTYIHIWGSTKVELLDTDGVVLYKSPTGALKPLFDFLMLPADRQKVFKTAIREQRKGWETQE